MNRPSALLPTELPEAVAAQIEETRYRLKCEMAAAGMAEALVDDAIARAVDEYRNARVHAFIGVLVERQVREALGLHHPGSPHEDVAARTTSATCRARR